MKLRQLSTKLYFNRGKNADDIKTTVVTRRVDIIFNVL